MDRPECGGEREAFLSEPLLGVGDHGLRVGGGEFGHGWLVSSAFSRNLAQISETVEVRARDNECHVTFHPSMRKEELLRLDNLNCCKRDNMILG